MTMSNSFFHKVLLVFVLFFVFISAGFSAQETGKNPEQKKFTLGFSERFRLTGWDNAIDLDASRESAFAFSRHLTSLSALWKPKANLEFMFKLSNEFRIYSKPEDREFNLNEVFVDNLYFQWKDLGGLPLTLKLGRQNIMLGEGFVVMDGHPLDGSRSIYFNAGRLDISLSPKNRLSLFYTYQPVTDTMPVIHDQSQPLVEQPEQGLGAYFTHKTEKNGFDAYVIRKDVFPTAERSLRSEINTLGMRFVLPLFPVMSLTGEGAYQFGSWGDYSRGAFGGYFHLVYNASFQKRRLPMFTVGSIYLSGDDHLTDKMEGWDPLFSRWPKWSESYIYALIIEQDGKVAYWSNFISMYESMKIRFTSQFSLILTNHHLYADKNAPPDKLFPGGSGKNRGSLWIAKAVVRINRNLAGHLVYETFSPGSFYSPDASRYYWVRFELKLSL